MQSSRFSIVDMMFHLYPMSDFYQLIQQRSSSDKTIYQ